VRCTFSEPPWNTRRRDCRRIQTNIVGTQKECSVKLLGFGGTRGPDTPKNGSNGAMKESFIRFPITCPRCGHESLTEFRAVVVTIATVEWHSMRLYASCHKVFWDASDLELEQIGAYLGASWIGASSIA